MSRRNIRGSRPRRRPRDAARPGRSAEWHAAGTQARTSAASRRRTLEILVVVVTLLLALAVLAPILAPSSVPAARGATPEASPAAGDVRTSTAPGLVGDPLFAVAGVAIITLAAIGVTLLYVRLTDDR